MRQLLLLPLLLLACDDGFSQSESADIIVEPSSELVFSRVGKDDSAVQKVRIQHGGEIPFNITAIYLTRPGEDEPDGCDLKQHGVNPGELLPPEMETCDFYIESRAEWPKELDNNQFIDIDIRYKQRGADAPSDRELVIQHDIVSDRMEPVRLQVIVHSGQPQMATDPNTVAFPPSISSEKMVAIHNLGNAPLNVDRIFLRHLTDPVVDPRTGESRPLFSLNPPPDAPWEIQPNESEQVILRFEPEPSHSEPAIAELVFQSNDYRNGRCVDQPERSCTGADGCAADDLCMGEHSVHVTSEEIQGLLEISPSPVIFGRPQAGAQIEKQINFSNLGLRTLFVLDMHLLQEAEDYSLGAAQISFQLQGGASKQITITYAPRSAEGGDATLVVETDADNASTDPGYNNLIVKVPLVRTGESLPGILHVDPMVLDLSEAPRGGSLSGIVTLSNPGGAPLHISRIALSSSDDAEFMPSDPQFSLIRGAELSLLETGASHEIEISFSRPTEGNAVYAGTLLIFSDEAGLASVNLMAQPPRD